MRHGKFLGSVLVLVYEFDDEGHRRGGVGQAAKAYRFGEIVQLIGERGECLASFTPLDESFDGNLERRAG